MPQANSDKPVKKPNWRLKKTLKRKTESRPLEPDDFRFLFAAYKDGRLATMGERFASGDLEPAEFRDELEQEILESYDGAWTMLAESPRGFMPVGVVFGFFSHRRPDYAPFMIVGDIIWFPWANTRNKIEAAVNFFNLVRSEIPFMDYADMKSKPFFEAIAKHGIMRRVGTTHNVYQGQPVAIFETRRP